MSDFDINSLETRSQEFARHILNVRPEWKQYLSSRYDKSLDTQTILVSFPTRHPTNPNPITISVDADFIIETGRFDPELEKNLTFEEIGLMEFDPATVHPPEIAEKVSKLFFPRVKDISCLTE